MRNVYILNNFEKLSDFCNSDFYDKTSGALYSLWSRAIPEKFEELKKVNYNSKLIGDSSKGKTQAFEVWDSGSLPESPE